MLQPIQGFQWLLERHNLVLALLTILHKSAGMACTHTRHRMLRGAHLMPGVRCCVKFGIAPCLFALVTGQGCPSSTPEAGNGNSLYNNTTDRTNNSASYIGSDTCIACHTSLHPDIVAKHNLHGHAYMLNPIMGASPVYPAAAWRSDVPSPPSGKSWFDVSYVIGGYIRQGRFIGLDGYTMTDGLIGVNAQWNLEIPANGTTAGWAVYDSSQLEPQPYGYGCFVCHTTGPQSLTDNGGFYQNNKPGYEGTWAEEGIQCEACHGPGSRHLPNPAARDLYVDLSGATCNACHSRPFGSSGSVIQASDGYIQNYQQYPELCASGGHSSFSCNQCHDPHAGTNYDRANAIATECTTCHPSVNMAIHDGKTFVNGDYVEQLECESCHMPYATKSATTASAAFVGNSGATVGDMRTHIFRINTDEVNYTAMFNNDGSQVTKDSAGRASVTVDYVCLRCHNDIGNAFQLTIRSASEIALRMHGN